ncbi:hypothetical protein CC85DRAFT_201985 [Cutaneotrichosporon oleaginosum]|uniref:N-acetyltransferase domain-containing protein n=1 Tax=Cutaneotrichosporon oleaginosum TaxID=879819 RepID=A0A0J0XUD5_9TREE|nr:uncharacterized protein CC85DRAFT_201985 [Cutaneotrichosporon oleaginosum]KLT44693.1 hypothetical protein CC85DRAFT_201985 [Cutaneotrichosporon oleaginosum]TXT07679.1 hypothetical protein COLE_04603 [Cutaneotrichosporon oleaginosum]
MPALVAVASASPSPAPVPAPVPALALSSSIASTSRPSITPRRSRSPRKISVAIDKASPAALPSLIPRLADIALAQEHGLVAPYTRADAAQLYDLPLGVGAGKCLLLVARDTAVPLRRGRTGNASRTREGPREGSRTREGGEDTGEQEERGGEARKGHIVGSVQLHFHAAPNGWFRADVRGLVVHPDYVRRGVGRRLMEAVEEEAKACKTKLLVSGDTRRARWHGGRM